MQRASYTNFLHWTFGYSASWPVRCEGGPLDGRGAPASGRLAIWRRWVSVRDGREMTVRLRDREFTLLFNNPVDLHSARRWLRRAPRPFLQKLELPDPYGEQPEGMVTFVRTALPGRISGPVPLVFSPSTSGSGQNDDIDTVRTLEHMVSLPALEERGYLLLATAPLLTAGINLGSEPQVTLHLHDGHRLVCLPRPAPPGHYLEIREVTKGPPVASGARLVLSEQSPSLLATAPETVANDLTDLLPRQHDNLAFWLAYEEQQTERERDLLARRQQTDLEYDEVRPPHDGGQGFDLLLVNGKEALATWVHERNRRQGRRIRLGVSVEVRPLSGEGEPVEGELCELVCTDSGGGRVRATLKLSQRQDVPYHNGKLRAVEPRGDLAQRQRRQRAMERLRAGRTACPDLLAHLYNPENVPEVGGRPATYQPTSERPLQPQGAQLDAIIKGIKEPDLLIVQGPPGTGKTYVISEIVDQVRQRHRRREVRDGARPVRILVSSVQNEAINNAIERLSAGGSEVLVYTVRSGEQRKADHRWGAEEALRRALAVRAALEGRPEFIRHARATALRQHLHDLQVSLGELRPLSELSDAIARLKDDEQALNCLTPDIKMDLERLLRDLDEAAVENASGEGESARISRQPDPTALLVSLAALPAVPDAESARIAIPYLERLDLVWEQEGKFPAHLETLLSGWLALKRRLEVNLRPGELRPPVQKRWTELVNAARTAIEHTKRDVRPEHFATGASNTLLVDVARWLDRAQLSVSRDFEERRHTEEAVLFDWVTTLEQEPRTLANIAERYAPLSAATCQMTDVLAGGGASNHGIDEEQFFDMVIIDEAARAGMDVLIPMSLGRSIILVGDHLQLPPHIEDDLVRKLDQEILDRVDEIPSLFKYLRDRLPTANFVPLTRQYRMHEDIGRLVSRVFYEEEGIRLEHYFGGDRANLRRSPLGVLENSPVVWVDSQNIARGKGADDGVRWPFAEENPREIEVIMALLGQLEREPTERLRDELGGRRRVVGIITFYQRQRERIEGAVETLPLWLRELVDVGTVDSYQGREYPLVVLSCVRSNDTGRVGFLSRLPQRINVAMSRAQRQLVIVGDSSTVAHREPRGSPWLRRIHQELLQGSLQGRVIDALEVLDA